jgi:methyl-accepting chemotaxis protein
MRFFPTRFFPTRLRRLKWRVGLGLRIGAVGAIGVFGLSLVGGAYLVSDRMQTKSQRDVDASAALMRAAEGLSQDAYKARRLELEFLLSPKASLASDHAAAANAFSARLDKLDTQLAAQSGDEGLLRQVSALRSTAGACWQEFKNVVAARQTLGYDENHGLLGRLRDSVHAVEADLLEADADPHLAVLMLMMRRHEKDFLARLDPKYGDEMKKRAAEFATALAGANLPATVNADVAHKMADYQRDFASLFDGRLDLASETDDLAEAYAAVQPLITDFEAAIARKYDAAQAGIAESRSLVRKWMIGGLALVTGAAGLAAWLLGRSVSMPVRRMAETMRRLSQGEANVGVPGTGRRDEIGEMAKAVQVFKDNMAETEHLRAEQEEQKKQAEEQQRQAMLAMADSFEAAVGDIVRGVSSQATELQATAQSMSATAEETERQSTAVAAASEEASTNVQTVASAAEELSSSIAEISRQVATSSDITARAVEDTRRTNEQIQGLAEAAQSIGDVVKLISDIASQTNLLALNATIEAARAGDAGKGFAVVASEVKSLASQTAKATEEISTKITEMQTATSHSVTAVQEIGQTIARINEIATTIASAVEEQGAATQEIARNVQQASAGTTEVSMNIAGVTRAANDTGAASTQVLGTAGELALQSEALRGQVENFLANIRSV